LVFSVTDTGIGIDPQTRGRLFQSFSQGDASISRRYGGTGLGLVISKRLCELMGGRIELESEQARGTTVRFTVRVGVVADGAPASREPGREVPAVRPERILLAEDNLVNQKVALSMLRHLGYQADVAFNGREVLERVAQQPYDVILMDVQMPDLDGLEATRRILAMPADPDRPRPWIIAVTANTMPGDREVCLSAGMDDYIGKPLKIKDLEIAMARFGQRGRTK
jgi:CheY-like chemotaxis protein